MKNGFRLCYHNMLQTYVTSIGTLGVWREIKTERNIRFDISRTSQEIDLPFLKPKYLKLNLDIPAYAPVVSFFYLILSSSLS